jgi:hypothetical protein
VLGLLLNDHIFKHETWLPAWLTGKLSDFFGMVVAPLTLCALFARHPPGRSPWSVRRRFVCFAVPVSIFVATELSQPAADRVAELVGMTGLSWKLWADPMDLLALTVLPGAWLLAEWWGRSERVELGSGVLARVPVFLGALACVATGKPVEARYDSAVYLVNRTDEIVEVDVAELRGTRNCRENVRLEPGVLRHEDFVNKDFYTLRPNQVLPLHNRNGASASCGPVRLTIDGETYGVQWDATLAYRSLPEIASATDLQQERQLVILERANEARVLRYGEGTVALVIAEVLAPVSVSDCEPPRLPHVEASVLPTETQHGRITNKTDLGGGCFALTIERATLEAEGTDAGGSGGSGAGGANAGESGAGGSSAGGPGAGTDEILICVPASEFPFGVGEEIHFRRGSIDDSKIFFEWHTGKVTTASPALQVSDAACGQVREPCGGVWQPLDVAVDGNTLPVGQRVRTSAPGSWPTIDDYLVRALRPLIVRSECGPGLDGSDEYHVELIRVRRH